MLVAVLAIQYTLFIPRLAAKPEKYRPVAAKINALVPDQSPLYVFKAGDDATCQNLLFYLHPPAKYLNGPRQIDSHVEYLLVHEGDYEKLAAEANLDCRSPMNLLDFILGRDHQFRLVKLATAATDPGGGHLRD